MSFQNARLAARFSDHSRMVQVHDAARGVPSRDREITDRRYVASSTPMRGGGGG